MRSWFFNCACAALTVASAGAGAQQIEFRIVEMTGQTTASPADPILDFAVQGRVVSENSRYGLGTYFLNIQMAGESESRGQLSRLRASNADSTYFEGLSTSALGGGTVGLPKHMYRLAGFNSAFNGLINSSAATWIQGPDQDIGLIAGNCGYEYLLGIPGVDEDGDGTPDVSTSDGTAELPAPVMLNYFGAGQFIDLYRFRYQVTDFTARAVPVSITGDSTSGGPFGDYFTTVSPNQFGWYLSGNAGTSVFPTVNQGFTFAVVPSPAGALAFGFAAVFVVLKRRRQ